MKLGSLVLSFLALTCAGGLESASLADSHGKFPGKGSVEAYNRGCRIANQAEALALKSDYLGAVSLVQRAITLYPYDSASYHNLACYQSELKKYDDAILSEKKALALEPNFAEAWLKEGECYEFSGRLAQAEQCYRKSFQIDDHRWGACFNIGDALLQQNKPKEARNWFLKSQGLTNNPKFLSEVEDRLKKLKPMLEASN